MFILQIIGAILILSFLIFIHELGHFLAAKKNGVKVHEFALGFPPTLFKRKRGDTEYKLNLIPFGGYVKLHGEDSFDPKVVKDKKSFASKTPWQKIEILTAGVLMNFLVFWILSTGALMLGSQPYILDMSDLENAFENGYVDYEVGFVGEKSEEAIGLYEKGDGALLGLVESGEVESFIELPAWSILSVGDYWNDYLSENDLVVAVNNVPIFNRESFVSQLVSTDKSVVTFLRDGEFGEVYVDYSYDYEVSKVFEGGVADASGVMVGDVIKSVDGVDLNKATPVVEIARDKIGDRIEYEISREGEAVSIYMTPEENGLVGMALLPVYNDPLVGFGYVEASYPVTIHGFDYNIDWWMAPFVSLQDGWEISKLTASGFVGTLADIAFSFNVSEEVGGPVQVAKLSYEFVGLGGTELMNFIALISLSLAVINILPIPALDGGRILFVIIEALRGKPLSRKFEAYIHAAGFLALMSFILVITVFDLLRL